MEKERRGGQPVPRPGLHGKTLPERRGDGAGREMALRVRQGREPDGTLHRNGKMAGREEGALEVPLERGRLAGEGHTARRRGSDVRIRRAGKKALQELRNVRDALAVERERAPAPVEAEEGLLKGEGCVADRGGTQGQYALALRGGILRACGHD